MFYAASIISLIILIPGTILVSSLIVRRYGTPWRLLFLGALAFLVGEILRNTIMGAVTGTDFYRAVAEMPSPIPLIFFFAFSLAIFQFAVRCGGFWAAFRYGGDKARPRVGAMTFSVGFSGIDAIFTYGFALLLFLLQIISISQASAPPEGVTPSDFAAYKSQVDQILAAPFVDDLVRAQILPAVANFVLQFAVSMIIWVGMVGKKWPWLVAGFLWEAAMVSVFITTSEWLGIYVVNHELYWLNLLGGSAILGILILINLGIIYVIYTRVNPLLGDAVKYVPPPAPTAAKPTLAEAPRPKGKPLDAPVPPKKLKNTDLK